MANTMISTIFLALLSLAFAQDSLELNCRVKKISNKKWYGKSISSVYTETEIECAKACYDAKYTKGCKSVNYQETTQRCEMLADTYDLPADSSGFLSSFPYVTYMEVVVCTGSALPTETEPTRPPPGPGPKPPTSVNTTSSIKAGTCGLSSVPNKLTRAALTSRSHRIVGGIEARAHSLPYIVSLRTPRSNFHFCGGTLVRVGDKQETDIVVTAAHCFEDGNTNVMVVAGAHYVSDEADGEQRVGVSRVVLHPSYNYPAQTNNDIAILKLEEPIKFSDTVQPACLPKAKEIVPDGTNLMVAGWGVTRENGISPDALQQVIVPVVNPEKCKSLYGRGQIVPETMLCAGHDMGMKDACQGDSGGPLVYAGKDGYTLQGVVSWGNGCARARAPGIYARVSTYIDFIQSQIDRLSDLK